MGCLVIYRRNTLECILKANLECGPGHRVKWGDAVDFEMMGGTWCRSGQASDPIPRMSLYFLAEIAQSVQRFATGWAVGGSRFSGAVQTGPGAHPAPYTMGTGLFPGVKRPARGVTHLAPHLAPRLNKDYNYTSIPPLDLRGLL
jgi:hypothetical protein